MSERKLVIRHPLLAGCFRDLSPSIALKRNNLAVDLTVSSLYADVENPEFLGKTGGNSRSERAGVVILLVTCELAPKIQL